MKSKKFVGKDLSKQQMNVPFLTTLPNVAFMK